MEQRERERKNMCARFVETQREREREKRSRKRERKRKREREREREREKHSVRSAYWYREIERKSERK